MKSLKDYENLTESFIRELIVSADELGFESPEEYVEFLCEDLFDVSFDEAYERGLVCGIN